MNIINNSIVFDSCLGSRVATPNVRSFVRSFVHSFVHSSIRRYIGPSPYCTDVEVNEANEAKDQSSLASGMTVNYSTIPVVVMSASPP